MTADVTGILRETSLLRSVSAEDLAALAAASRLRSFRRGQVVFTRSDPGDSAGRLTGRPAGPSGTPGLAECPGKILVTAETCA
jgi:hypothetical protein